MDQYYPKVIIELPQKARVRVWLAEHEHAICLAGGNAEDSGSVEEALDNLRIGLDSVQVMILQTAQKYVDSPQLKSFYKERWAEVNAELTDLLDGLKPPKPIDPVHLWYDQTFPQNISVGKVELIHGQVHYCTWGRAFTDEEVARYTKTRFVRTGRKMDEHTKEFRNTYEAILENHVIAFLLKR